MKEIITIGTLFSGMGSAFIALSRLVGNIKVTRWNKYLIIPAFCAENNSVANQIRKAILKQNFNNVQIPNLGDVTQITENNLKVYINAVDFIVFGSPCQDFSSGGKQKGGNKNSGTRSSLLWEAVRIINIIKPKYVIFENVKGILSFPKILKQYYDELDAYDHAQPVLLDPVKYNIPMKRPRVFVVSILKELNQKELVKTLPNKLLMQRKPLTKKLYEMMVHHRIDLYDNYYPLPKRLYYNNGVFAYLKQNKNSFDRVWNVEKACGTFSYSGRIKIHDDAYWMELNNQDKLRLMGFCYKPIINSKNNYSWNDFSWINLFKTGEPIKEYQLSRVIGNAMSVDMLMLLFKTILVLKQ